MERNFCIEKTKVYLDYNLSLTTLKITINDEQKEKGIQKSDPLPVYFSMSPSCSGGEVVATVDEANTRSWVHIEDREAECLKNSVLTISDRSISLLW